MELRAATHTDQGRVRAQNEDAVLADPPLVAVADGMGGHEGGEVASSLALEVLSGWKQRLEGLSGKEASERLREAFTEVNRAVFTKGQEDETLAGMGTTLTAAWIDDAVVALAHVGDSRAYLLRGDAFRQLTQDQTVAQEWVRRGRLSEEEAATSPHRHILLQAIGAEGNRLDVETASVELRAGDRLLLATDGLYGMVSDDERLREILASNPDGDAACRALVDAANAAGGEDNISVVIVDVIGDPEEGDGAAAGSAAPVVIERHVDEEPARPAPAAEHAPRRRPRRALLAGGAVLLLAAMALVLLIRPAGSSYVVSSRSGIVVVLKGRTGDAGTPARGEVVRSFADEKLDEFPATTQRQLRAGIEVESIAEGERVIARLPRILGPLDTPTPEPTPASAPTPAPAIDPAASPAATTAP